VTTRFAAGTKTICRIADLKLLLLGRYSSRESIERFRREAQSAAALRHPNIVASYEVGECDSNVTLSAVLTNLTQNLADS
jgi:serine/threonine protein kinase